MGSREEEEEQEEALEYCPGGYHPLVLGDWLNKGRYFCTRKLGWGQFSTVWLAWDTLERRFVAVKVVKSSAQYTEVAQDEIRLLLEVRRHYSQDGGLLGMDRVVQLLDHFRLSGPNGTHQCMVFDVLGVNLLKLLAETNYKGLPLIQVRQVVRQVLEGLHYLHSVCGVIHCDIKPENILLATTQDQVRRLAAEAFDYVEAGRALPASFVCSNTLPLRQRRRSLCYWGKVRHSILGPEDVGMPDQLKDDADMRRQLLLAAEPLGPSSVVIADLGNACYVDNHFSDEIQTRQYRSYEVLIGADYGPSADTWSVACMAYEMATGRFLFSARSDEKRTAFENHVSSIEALLGPAPKHLALSGHLSRNLYAKDGCLLPGLKQGSVRLDHLLMREAAMEPAEAGKFADFLEFLLDLDWRKRPNADQALHHPWMKN